MSDKYRVLLIIGLDVEGPHETQAIVAKIADLNLPYVPGHLHMAIDDMATNITMLLEDVPQDYIGDVTCYDENTLFKVDLALQASGLNREQARDAINEMQNEGILFRERI